MPTVLVPAPVRGGERPAGGGQSSMGLTAPVKPCAPGWAAARRRGGVYVLVAKSELRTPCDYDPL